MDSKTMSHPQNQERRSITKTIRVKVPSKRPTSSSSSTANPRKQCNHPSSRHTQLLMQNHSNFKRSEAPTRIMFYEGGSWVDFPGEVVRYLRSEFSGGKPMVGASIDGSRYLFDFMRMLQTDFASGRERSIAWIDDNGKCFFPKLFVGSEDFAVENSEDAKIDIEIRINGDSISGNGKREMVEVEGDQNVVSSNNNEEISSKRRRAVTPGLEASRWQCPDNGEENSSKRQRVVTPGLEASRWPNAKPLKEGDGAYQLVKKHFLLGVRNVDPSATISSIYQCTRTGPLERARWEVFRKQTEITKAARGSANTIFAWYGTSAKGVVSILMHGFGMPSQISGSEAHGVGIYLSPASLPQMSAMRSEADDNGEKHLILCRVIVGNVEKVEAGSQQSHPSSVNFDTGVDDLKNPKQYVVWCANMNSHILPECVVSYKFSNHVPGQLRGSAVPNWVPNASNSYGVKLFSKLESSLPSEKVRELENLCGTFKVGKVAKDVFIKQLRSIAGDEMLLSTIREMRGSNEAGKVAKDILMKQLQLIAGDEMLIPMIRDIHGSD